MLLQSKVIEGVHAQDCETARRATLAELKAERVRDETLDNRKDRVERIVGRVADNGARDRDEVERLMDEALERLEDEDLYGEIVTRPMGELVAALCRDLGLDPDWASLAQEPWALAEIASGAAGSPFAAWMARPPPAWASGLGVLRSATGPP